MQEQAEQIELFDCGGELSANLRWQHLGIVAQRIRVPWQRGQLPS
jgi:hypothetical protein